MPRLNLIGETIGKMVLRDLEMGTGVGVRGLEVTRDSAFNTSRFLENTLGKLYFNRCTGSEVKFWGLMLGVGVGG